MALRWLGLLGVIAIGGCGSSTEPVDTRVQHGLYVLASLDGQSPLFVINRYEFGDTLTFLDVIEFDSIRVLDDTSFERHRSMTQHEIRNGHAPVVFGTGSFRLPGRFLPRDDEILLLDPTLASLIVEPGRLRHRVPVVRLACVPVFKCTVLQNRFGDAIYTRR
jgi:hypothetical protein